jgi:hypothetical protein
MPKVQLNTGGGAGDGQSYEAFPADTYFCEIKSADLELSKFKDDKTGEDKYQIAIVWEVYQLTEDQEAEGLTTGKWFRQWFSPYYGETKNGPSLFKAFIDALRAQGHLDGFDPNDFDTDDLIGIKQKVTVTEKPKADGTMTNKVTGVSPLKPQRRQAAQPAPAAKPAAPAAPARRNVPQPVAVGADDGEELF